jgi:hypothetical protein
MNKKLLTSDEVLALENGTEVYCEWNMWIGKGTGFLIKQASGIEHPSRDGWGFSFNEIDGNRLKVFLLEQPKKPDMEKIREIIGVFNTEAYADTLEIAIRILIDIAKSSVDNLEKATELLKECEPYLPVLQKNKVNEFIKMFQVIITINRNKIQRNK